MITYENTFNGLSIQADIAKGYACYVDILQKLYDLIMSYISRHNKVLFVRFDVRFPQSLRPDPSNMTFQRFIADLAKFCSREGYDPDYLWVREGREQCNQHYHCLLLLNGNHIQSTFKVVEKAQEVWNRKLKVNYQGLIYDCNRAIKYNRQSNGIMLRRNDPNLFATLAHCFHWASYLAKVNTKDASPYRVRDFGSSRIPQDWSIHPKVESILL